MSQPSTNQGQDFLRAIVAEDLQSGRHASVVTRFPPEPNGYLHIGHATSVVLNFGVAAETGGRCHLRFDDTNPETEEQKYVDSIIDTVRWLGYDWGEHLYFASDYFERMYGYAEHMIRQGKAYVDSLSEAEIREYRGTVMEPGRPSPYRERSVEENLDLFHRMRDGEFPDGAHVLRARIDMASNNMLLRDPVLYRIRHASHYRTGGRWCVYPLYDFAHPIEDAIECVTHSFCTLEFENNRALYDWVVENLPRGEPPAIPPESRPRQYEFARRNFEYTIVSKRKLLQLVRDGHVTGWDDPRMPTLAGLRRRGYTAEAIRTFCETIGVGKAENRVDIATLEHAIRDDLNSKAPRVLCVLRPLRVVLTNYPEDKVEELDAPFYPHDVPKEGSRPLPFSRTLFIDRDDFREDPPQGFFRLSPGAEVRLRYAYVIRCDEVVKDEQGEVVELRCAVYPETRGGKAPEGRTIRGTIHWVSAGHAVPCTVRLYDRLFAAPDPEGGEEDFKRHLNPDSLVVVEDALIEPGLANHPPGSHFQFERVGYFFSDPQDSVPGRPVFNRTVTLRDTWAKVAEKQQTAARPAAGQTPAGKTPVGQTPAGETPAGQTPVGQTPAGQTPAGKSPAPGDGVGRTEKRRSPKRPDSAGAATEPARSPELQARRERFRVDLGLGPEEAEILTRDAATADLFEAAVAAGAAVGPTGAAAGAAGAADGASPASRGAGADGADGAERAERAERAEGAEGAEGASPAGVANWVIHELPRILGGGGLTDLRFSAVDLGELVALVEGGTLSSSAAREVLAEMAGTGASPREVVARRGLEQVSDPDRLQSVVDQVLAAYPGKVEEYRGGKVGLLGFFIGQVMRETGGKANPELAKEIIDRRVGG